MSNNKMDGFEGALEVARAVRELSAQLSYLERIAVALERLAGPNQDAYTETCPECEGQNLSPHRLRYCMDCEGAHFEDSAPSQPLDNLD